MNNSIYYVGVDIGKTKIACGLFTEELILIDSIVRSSGQCAQEILNSVEDAIAFFFACHNNIAAIGIGTFGVVDIQNGIVLSSGIIKDWNKILLREYFEECFRVPVFVENDVKTALYGEMLTAENKDYKSILYLSIGTSIGVAFMQEGLLLRGDHGRLGEIYRFLPRNTQYTLGQLVGGRGISLQYYNETGLQKSCQELIAIAEAGDTVATQIFCRFVLSLSDLIHWLAMCFDPGCIIIGGGLLCHNPKLFQMIREQYQLESNEQISNISLAKFGANSGIYGAAALAKNYANNCNPYYY